MKLHEKKLFWNKLNFKQYIKAYKYPDNMTVE